MRKKTKIVLLTLAALFIVIQFFQPERTNPPSDPAASFEAVVKPPPQVAAVVERACQDCHSNRTVWPWYNRVAPASWLLAYDVKHARRNINLSEWGKMSPARSQEALGDMCDEVKAGEMPLWQYKLMHSSAARLTPADVAAICSLSAAK